MNILMVEDDPDITLLLVNYLKLYQINVTAVERPSAALERLEKEQYELLILDLTLPEMDGLQLCRMIREKSDIPIVVSSARGDLDDKIVALEYGADDYLPKPYEPRELVARIKSVLRRYYPSSEIGQSRFEVRHKRREILFDGAALELTPAEYEVMRLLIQNAGTVVTREFLISNAPSISDGSSLRTIDVIVSRLRQKIEEEPKMPYFIKSIRNRGYRFDG